MLRVIGTALLTAILTSLFWIWFYGVVPQPAPQVARSGTGRDDQTRRTLLLS